MKIYTKTGDNGTTSLWGRPGVPKNDIQVNAYGEIDELNAAIGVALSHINESKELDNDTITSKITELLSKIQHNLFDIGAELSAAKPDLLAKLDSKIDEPDIRQIEKQIDDLDSQLPPLKNFVLPSGPLPVAHLHLARTICRRAERSLLGLHQQQPIRSQLLQFINRLSDYLFVCARYLGEVTGHSPEPWKKKPE